MIINFSKDIKLESWLCEIRDDVYGEEESIWTRKLVPYADFDWTTMVSVRKNLWAPKCYANFYSQLSFLHDHFPKFVEGDLEFSKRYVDNFLIKMSGLTAFL
jgi:hypothetical protein